MTLNKNSLAIIICSVILSLYLATFLSVSTLNLEYLENSKLRSLLEEVVRHPPHKDLLPLDSSDWYGSILVSIGLLIAASGGIGGGGILVPLFILVFGFRPKYAIALSNFTILGSSITNMILNIPKRHPLTNRPLVDWDLILVMEPLTMAGAVIGAFLSKILPDWLLVIALVILLAFTTYTTLEKGIEQYTKETKAMEIEKKSALARVVADEEEREERVSLLEKQEESEKPDATPESKPEQVESVIRESDVRVASKIGVVSQELEELLKEESTTPWDKVKLVSTMIAVVIILNLIKMTTTCGENTYWLLTAAVFIWILGFSYHMRSILIQKWKLKSRLHYRYVQGDVEWNPRNTIIYPCICFFAGFFAGLFGVGGGIVKGPLMLQMGVHPLVASGTCAVMIMFTSVAATTMFIAFGTLTWDYAWFLFVLGLLATVVGQFGVSYLVKKYNRVSLVSLSIGAVVALSTVLMAIQSVITLVDSDNNTPSQSGLCS